LFGLAYFKPGFLFDWLIDLKKEVVFRNFKAHLNILVIVLVEKHLSTE
jgi:hypothetical protein